MTSKEYIDSRLQTSIDWYDTRSRASKRYFNALRFAEIALAAALPLVSVLTVTLKDFSFAGVILTAVIAVIISIVAGVLSLGNFQEDWIEYRTICEGLKKEKIMFEADVAPYDSEDSFNLLVQRSEALISKENTHWAEYIRKSKEGKAHDKT